MHQVTFIRLALVDRLGLLHMGWGSIQAWNKSHRAVRKRMAPGLSLT